MNGDAGKEGELSPIHFDNELLQRVKRELQTGRPHVTPDLSFSGKDTPPMLFHAVGNKRYDLKRLQTGRLNPDRELTFFSSDPGVTHTFGMWIANELRQGLFDLGLKFPDEEDKSKKYKASDLADRYKYLMVIFPHYDTDLGKWVADQTNPFLISPDYITDQDIPIHSKVTIVRYDALEPFIERSGPFRLIKGFTNQQDFRSKLDINDEQQEQLRQKIAAEIERRGRL